MTLAKRTPPLEKPKASPAAPQEAPKAAAAPESPRAALGALREAVSLDNLEIRLRQIEQNPRLSSLEKLGKTVEVYFKAYEGEIDKILDALGLKEEEIEPFLPNDSTPPEENYADAPEGHMDSAKIKPSEERDIIGFLGQKNWMPYVRKACARFGVPIFVLLGIIRRESSFNPLTMNYIDPQTGKLKSTATGLGQFRDCDWKNFLNSPENPWGPSIGMEGRLNPEYAIFATARHIRNKVEGVKRLIARAGKDGFPPPHFELNLKNAKPEDVKWIYMSYASGAWGYCLLRRYFESPDEKTKTENYAKLRDFQQEKEYSDPKTGKVKLRSYTDRITRATNGGVATAKAFYNQIQTNQPELLAVHQKQLEAID